MHSLAMIKDYCLKKRNGKRLLGCVCESIQLKIISPYLRCVILTSMLTIDLFIHLKKEEDKIDLHN